MAPRLCALAVTAIALGFAPFPLAGQLRYGSAMEDAPFHIDGPGRPGPWLITVDHATNRVPAWVAGGDLGIPKADMARHIAFDIGALQVARHLGQMLHSPVISSNFSRLVIDPNRGLDDPTLIMQLYDGTIIPGNRNLDHADRARRIETLYTPYHDAYGTLAARGQGGDDGPDCGKVIVAIHSFTPQLRARPPRPWQVGVLFAHDTRLSDPFIDLLEAQGDVVVGRNQPYDGHLPGDSVDRHALASGRMNVLIELRNDLIADEAGQMAWAARLAPMLEHVLTEFRKANPHGSTDPD